MTSEHPTGDPIHLRPLEEADAPAIARWLEDPAIASTLLGPPGCPQAAREGWRDEVARSAADVNLGIALPDGRLVGVAALAGIDDARRGWLGLFVGERAEWGRGLGREAAALMVAHGFERLGLEEVAARVVPENARALRVYARLGFTRRGLEAGTLVLSLRREEWERSRAGSK